MKEFKYLFVGVLSFIIFGSIAKAEPTVILEGANSYGNNLYAKVTIPQSEFSTYSIKNIDWYSCGAEVSNPTTGQCTNISSTQNSGSGYITSFPIDESLIGKVILVNVKFDVYDDQFNVVSELVISVSTTDENNRTRVVSDYMYPKTNNPITISLKNEDEATAGSTLTVKALGLPDNYDHATDYVYYAYFTDSDTAPTPPMDGSGCKITSDHTVTEGYKRINPSGVVLIDDDYALFNDLNKAYIIKQYEDHDYTYCDVYTEPLTITRPELPPLGNRFSFFYFGESAETSHKGISIFTLFPSLGTRGDHKLQVSVGEITDADIIKKMANKDADAYESLLAYAKSSTPLYTGETHDRDGEIQPGDLGLIDGHYYYIYTRYTDSIYNGFEDVAIAQAKYDLLVNEVEYGYTDDPKVKEENPNTGAFISIATIGVLLVGGTISLIVAKKKSKIVNI